MQVRLFGRLAEYVGRDIEIEAANGCSVAALLQLVAKQDAGLGAALAEPGVRACVGQEFVGADRQLGAGDAVEFWPPVSGG